MNEIKVKNVLAAVSNKSVLDPLLAILDPKSLKFWGTEGTVKYLNQKGFSAQSVVNGFDFDGRVKTLGRSVFARILANKSNPKHLKELKKLKLVPFDLVIVDLYPPNNNNFPESMDIGGQALIRAAVKNYKNVALASDKKSIVDLSAEIDKNDGATTLSFRKKQAKTALKFIAERCKIEANLEL